MGEHTQQNHDECVELYNLDKALDWCLVEPCEVCSLYEIYGHSEDI